MSTLGMISILVLALGACGSSTKTVTVTNSNTAPASSAPTTYTTPSANPPVAVLHVASFQSPSGNIGCIVASGTARCDIKQRSWRPPARPASCPSQVDFGQGLEVGASGPGRLVCAGDTALNPSAHRLAYGTRSEVGSLRCDSASSGVTCTNTSTGHGFFISAGSYRIS